MAHPHGPGNHEFNRSKVCAPCGHKVKNPRSITDNIREILEKFYPSFDINNPCFPRVICDSCRKTIYKIHKDENLSHVLPVMPNYNDIILRKETRAVTETSELCNCYICLKARSHATIPLNKKVGRGIKKIPNSVITDGLVAAKESEPINPITPTKTPVNNKKNCAVCFQVIGKGIRHPCKVSKASSNVVRALDNFPDTVAEKVVSEILVTKATTTVGTSKNASLSLSSKAKNTRVVVNPKEISTPIITHESLDTLQQGLSNLSNTKMKGMANWCRTNLGKKCIPPGYKEHQRDLSSSLKDFYQKEDVNMKLKGDEMGTRTVVYANAKDVVERVCKERGIEGMPNVIITLDGGGGFFKVLATILPEDNTWTDDPENKATTSSKRSSYEDGGTLHKGKLSGVKRAIVLALVPEIKEDSNNFKILFDLIQLNEIHFKIVSDYKAMLITLGLQNSVSTWPCPYCFIKFKDLAEEHTELQTRTFGQLADDYKKFCQELKCNHKLAKLSHSTVNACLIAEDPATEVLEKYILPELHSILGVMNHLFFKGLCPLLTKEKALLWPIKLNQVAKGYHGDIFEGNACRVLISKAYKLLDIPEIYDEIPSESEKIIVKEKVQLFIDAINGFDKIVSECFGTNPVDINKVEGLVADFESAYKKIGISVTPKVHAIFDHLVPTLKLPYLKGHGLGVCTEQAGESFHFHFKENFWKNRKISSMSNPNYGNHLLAAVIECSSKAM